VPGHSGNPARQHNEAATEDQTIDKMSHEASDGDRPHRRNRRRQIRKFGHTVFVITQRMSFVENRFYDWLSGGFNYRIERHLLPFIARENWPLTRPIVVKTCREFRYRYHEYKNFLKYFTDHLRFLTVKGTHNLQPSLRDRRQRYNDLGERFSMMVHLQKYDD
jgi:hypothetical protein